MVLLDDDSHDQELIDQVSPADWVNPPAQPQYDLVVLGAGTAGLVSAAIAAGLGARVALVERELMGGDCLNYGCVPSKGLLAVSRRLGQLRRGGDYGLSPAEGEVDFAAVMERMRRIRAGIGHHDGAARFRDLGVDVFLGSGRFTSPRFLQVVGRDGQLTVLSFKRAGIATGARPQVFPVPGLD